jgi:hypothetical protein
MGISRFSRAAGVAAKAGNENIASASSPWLRSIIVMTTSGAAASEDSATIGLKPVRSFTALSTPPSDRIPSAPVFEPPTVGAPLPTARTKTPFLRFSMRSRMASNERKSSAIARAIALPRSSSPRTSAISSIFLSTARSL